MLQFTIQLTIITKIFVDYFILVYQLWINLLQTNKQYR